MNISFWEKESFAGKSDVVIVGAGLVGLSAATKLKADHPNLKVRVLEAGPWPGAASLRNAGFACFGSPSELLDDLSNSSPEEVAVLVHNRQKGLSTLRNLLGDQAIGYVDCPAYEVFAKEQEALATQCLDKLDWLNKLIKNSKRTKHYFAIEPPAGTQGFHTAIRIEGEGQIHPGRMMKSLEQKALGLGVQIQYGWPVSGIIPENDGFTLTGEAGKQLQSEKVLIATNGYSQKLLPGLDLRPARNQVIITAPIPGLSLQGNFHARAGYVYFRNVGNRLLIGGFRDLDPVGESTEEPGFTSLITEALQQFVNTHLLEPGSWEIDLQWSGILGVGNVKSPILEEIEPGLWCAVRLGGMGVALGAGLGAEAATRLLQA